MTKSRISSIGWLECADGSKNLTPCIDGSMHPTMVNVTAKKFASLNGDREAMKDLAVEKLSLINHNHNHNHN